MIWILLNWIMSAVALIGTIINAERNKVGFVFWLVSNLYMSIRFCVIGEYAQSTLFLIYFLLAIKGIAVWSEKEKKDLKNQKNTEKVAKLREYIENYK